MIKTLTNLEKTPITGKDDFDERLEALTDDDWKIVHFNSFPDYQRSHVADGITVTDVMATTHITKIAVLQK